LNSVQALQGVEGTVDLDRRKGLARESEFAALGKLWRIKFAAPAGVTPAGDTDANLS
jgi:hypothetical protein